MIALRSGQSYNTALELPPEALVRPLRHLDALT
jgi:hypothetical protein